jgi:LmbE family N-acetylglucosaminyl deacetylase
MKVLIFAPHPDDDVIGMGGSIAKHRSIDDFVTIIYLTSGGLTDDPEIRETEVTAAEKILGANKLMFLRWKDHEVGTDMTSRNKIRELTMAEEPHIIYCPSPTDQHKDHKATFELVRGIVNVPLYLYEVYPGMSPIEEYEDITFFLNKKILALREFKSQQCDLVEAYRMHARFHGIMSGKGDYVEAFKRYV